MTTALITGLTGQDGLYLAELLSAKGYRIVGAVRDLTSAYARIPEKLRTHVELVSWDMLDQGLMTSVLVKYQPSEIYNLAAYSSGAGMYDEPVDIGEVNGLAVTRILEAIRVADRKIRFCQASSREIFGEAVESPQSESTPVNPRSPYGAAKLYADNMIKIYRQRYDIFACSAILFNHESPRRGMDFVTRKITHTAAKIKLGLEKNLLLGSIEARRDWGFAGDYMYAMWLMLQQDTPDDYIVATGSTHTVREFCELAFGYLGLDYINYVREDASFLRTPEEMDLVGCIDKAKYKLGWQPRVSFKELIYMMVDAEMRLLS